MALCMLENGADLKGMRVIVKVDEVGRDDWGRIGDGLGIPGMDLG
jgi:hypothetical protein